MIYGLNFNGTHIPPNMKSRFAQEVKVDKIMYDLKGVCQSKNELNVMLGNANNGRRKVHVVDRSTKSYELYGVYCS